MTIRIDEEDPTEALIAGKEREKLVVLLNLFVYLVGIWTLFMRRI